MLQDNEKLVAKVNILEFENKSLIEALKVEKYKIYKDKQLNLLREEDNSSQLFSLL